jgi:hypothetical protein
MIHMNETSMVTHAAGRCSFPFQCYGDLFPECSPLVPKLSQINIRTVRTMVSIISLGLY